ncbi:chloride channel protein [Mesorhizobium sp. RMAD-H1]|uniref:chloride channel protein n=1 Tax=Mesorhizobium sp. RMAD-H1 TaxID=2587065 RepID=UPI001837784B|nr:chloride channel protein [Mesorhizobium sp. RMAD-H1]MBB2970536.1 CIC family chloride channel protein [Mesorhizobium sp. RMAD-H1]
MAIGPVVLLETDKIINAGKLRLRLLALLRILNARGIVIVLLACMVGVLSGAVVVLISWIVNRLHTLLYAIPPGARLSEMFSLSRPEMAFIPIVGGVLVGLTTLYVKRRKLRRPIDPIEANALYGGRMSITDTLVVVLQTILSSGFGASVGLEAAYTQAGSGLASKIACSIGLRRSDIRLLVGCGAGGAIAAAFGAPLTGAFYGFELIIGVYSVANVAPMMAAAVSASLVAGYFGVTSFPIELGELPPMLAGQYLPFLLLGLIAGGLSIAIMQLVTLVERLFAKLAISSALRPAIGGCLVGLLALMTPQVLSSGHGALHRELAMNYGLYVIVELFFLKLLASAVSIGSGFRGGLFFASLFLGALAGKIFAEVMAIISPETGIDPVVAAVIGMTSLAVGVVGGPLTMTFLALESTGDLTITGVVLAASIMSAILVRETFGYSFSTWRFHLRGETIRSAHDISWMRDLSVGRMMRENIRTIPCDMTVAQFREEVPLGSVQRIIAVEGDKKYVGMLIVAEVHALRPDPSNDEQPVSELIKYRDIMLLPTMNVKVAAEMFAKTGSEELAVVDDYNSRRVCGLLTEGYLLRRYAEELDKVRKDIAGER